MKMKRLFQLTLVGILSIFTSAFAQVSTAKWQSHSIVIDGDAKDWETAPCFTNSDSKINYEFRNDDRNLYLILKTTDENMQKQLTQAGFKLRFKVKAKQKITANIVFPVKKGGIVPPTAEMGKKPDVDQMQKPMNGAGQKMDPKNRIMPKEIALLNGFIFSKDTITSNKIDENRVSFANSNEGSVFEFQIPLREFFGDGYILDNIITNRIQLQVNINGKSESRGNGMFPGGMGGGPDGGMGGGFGGDMGMMPPPGGMPPFNGDMSDAVPMTKKAFTVEFNLSANNK